MALTIDIQAQGVQRTTLRLKGRLDTETAPQLESRLAGLLAAPLRTLVFDLASLDYVSSAGVRVLAKARKRMEELKGTLLVVNLQPPVAKVFEIIRALPSLRIFASVEELDGYLDMMQRREREGG